MTEQPKADHAEQERRERRIKWAAVFAATLDAVSRIADIVIRH
jgi:hypothetical protein